MAKPNKRPNNLAASFFLILCIMGFFAILSSTMSKNPVLNPFAKFIGIPEADPLLGFVAAASTIPGILVSLPAGKLSDIIGRKKILLFSGIIFASAPFLYLFITSPWQLLLVRFYHGFATAMFVPVASAAIAEKFPLGKGEKMSTFSSITTVGRTIAPILGGYILSGGYILPKSNWNYHGLYIAVAIAGICALFTALMLFRNETLERMPEKSSKGKSYFPSGIALVSLVEAAQYYTFGAYEFYLVDYATSPKIGLDALSIGIITGAQLAAIALVNPFAGRFSDKVGRKTPIVMGLIIGSVPLIITPFANSFFELILISVVYGFGFSLVTSSTGPLVSDLVSKEMYGTALGFLSTIMDVGQTLGPIITGFIFATALGYFGAFVSLGIILLVFSLVFSLQQVIEEKRYS
jgi:MFS family permease